MRIGYHQAIERSLLFPVTGKTDTNCHLRKHLLFVGFLGDLIFTSCTLYG